MPAPERPVLGQPSVPGQAQPEGGSAETSRKSRWVGSGVGGGIGATVGLDAAEGSTLGGAPPSAVLVSRGYQGR